MTAPGAPPPLGMSDFFALEAGEYLDRLDALLQEPAPPAPEPLQQVLKALQPLRGLAALNDLPPLPDLLEGIERAIGEMERNRETPPAGFGDMIAELFQMAATSIAHAAREVA